MRFSTTILVLVLLGSACSKSSTKVTGVERPNDTEFTSTRHVKKTDGRENKKRYLYYNSLQYKGAYKQF